ncbi:unnamed protein product [Eruca vesicaria subsp. sativa]|uniref:Uncharacterized protein n=1 Tax=Eruca vesicaria subsp. sativa TaxID=29727 RepID=A0ABC8LRF3_ERUVS|nr:unnamed protein product [Eruca vesicaria subsp. sativa]
MKRYEVSRVYKRWRPTLNVVLDSLLIMILQGFQTVDQELQKIHKDILKHMKEAVIASEAKQQVVMELEVKGSVIVELKLELALAEKEQAKRS